MTTLDVTNKDMSSSMFQSHDNLNSHNTFLLIIGVFKGYLPHYKKIERDILFPTVICAVSHGGLWVTKILLSFFLIFTNTIITIISSITIIIVIIKPL